MLGLKDCIQVSHNPSPNSTAVVVSTGALTIRRCQQDRYILAIFPGLFRRALGGQETDLAGLWTVQHCWQQSHAIVCHMPPLAHPMSLLSNNGSSWRSVQSRVSQQRAHALPVFMLMLDHNMLPQTSFPCTLIPLILGLDVYTLWMHHILSFCLVLNQLRSPKQTRLLEQPWQQPSSPLSCRRRSLYFDSGLTSSCGARVMRLCSW